ncbi:MAG TPA: glutaminase A [Pseudolabrys sp.]|nr:glutaminase A [Pseudolabrys sp.]
MDAKPISSSDARAPFEGAAKVTQLPLLQFLQTCHGEIASDDSGSVASYIPELAKADPNHFGISVATTDGYVYEVGDSAVPFTIQSISKAFVFALALETVGAKRVESVIGVEPSGEAFNSIRLRADNRPFNPMVNAGAIACSGLIYDQEGRSAFDRILSTLGRFAGRELGIDEGVFASERETGDRNRAIAYLLRTYDGIKGDVDGILDVYFRQCSVLVTARDIAVMAATLANRGVNPITGEQVITPYVVARTLSVMTSSGMYDYAGEWIYRVGIPAKSGVGGGIVAALPSQLGLGTYAPLLDGHGNSVRGLKVCQALSSRFDLHVFNRTGDVRNGIVAEYNIGGVSSRRNRQPHEQVILDERRKYCRVYELIGGLTFGAIEFLSRRLAQARLNSLFIILDFRRVPSITKAAAQLLSDSLGNLTEADTTVILCGIEKRSSVGVTIDRTVKPLSKLRKFALLDEAIEWAEDQIIYRYGGYGHLNDPTTLREQQLLAGLSDGEIAALASHTTPRSYRAGQRIVGSGEVASSLFFLQSGMVSVKLANGARLATLVAGMVFGEMALLEDHRSADVWADTAVQCVELPLDAYTKFREMHPEIGERIVSNLAVLLAKRLMQANTKIDLLTSH